MSVFVGIFVGLLKMDTVEVYSMSILSPLKSVSYMAHPRGFEPLTTWFVATHAIQCLCGLAAIISHKIPHIPPTNHAGLKDFCRTINPILSALLTEK